jgi:hypothetical protein
MAMTSSGRIFFAGVGTTFVILGIGFGAGLMLAKASIEPSARSYSSADPMSPVRVILPASPDPPLPSQTPVQTADVPPESQRGAPLKEVQQASETDRAERRKAEADERGRRKKVAERKARREAARLAQQQEQQQRSKQQPSIVAFGQTDDQPRSGGGFFGH